MSWTRVLKASIDNDKCNKVIDLMKDNGVDVDEASPNFVAEFASDYGYELTSEEVVYISDNYVKGYGVEYRNMHTAIHHIIITDTEEKAKQILELISKTLQEETNEKELQFIWEDINTLANDDIEVDYREIEENNGIYKGIKVINYNEHIPDVWE